MTTYYVRKDGHDDADDGSSENPWLTIQKAYTTIPIAGGHTIKVGAGTYEEDSGAGYFNPNRNFLAEVVIESESGNQDVILRGSTSPTYSIYVANGGPSNNLTLKNLDLTPQTITRAIILLRGIAANHWKLINCKLVTTSTEKALEIYPSNGIALSDITISNCLISAGNADYCFLLGHDGLGEGTVTTVSVSGCTIKSGKAGAHTFLIGGKATGVVVQNCFIDGRGSAYGVVLKENDHNSVTGCLVLGGSNSALYFKAGSLNTAEYNLLRVSAGGVGFRQYRGDTGNKSSQLSFRFNKVFAGLSFVGYWDQAGGDDGGNVVNYNQYKPGASKFGAIRADADVANFAELRAAWDSYDTPTNEEGSTLLGGPKILAGMMLE